MTDSTEAPEGCYQTATKAHEEKVPVRTTHKRGGATIVKEGTRKQREVDPWGKDPVAERSKNATPKKLHIEFASRAKKKKVLTAELDGRTALAKAVASRRLDLEQHLGDDEITVPLRSLCEMGARLLILSELSWTRIEERGVFDEAGSVNPAVAAFRESARDATGVLKLLGLEKRVKRIQSLAEYLGKEREDHSHETE